MKRLILAVGFLLTSGAIADDLSACGAKFLVPSRGTHFQRAPVPRQSAAILVYANPASPFPEAFRRLALDATLIKAGYAPTAVHTAAEFEDALGHGGWDLVIVDLSDGPAVSSRLKGPGAPLVLPIAHHPTSSELGRAKKEYTRVIKSPAKSLAILEAIDDTLAARRDMQAKASKPGR